MSTILKSAGDIWRTLSTSIADPASNPLAAVLGLAVLVLALLILVILAYLVITHPESRGNDEVPGEGVSADDARRTRDKRDRLWTGTLLVLVAAVAIAGIAYTSTDPFCKRCHYTERAFDSREEGSHPDVSCRACHEGGGVSVYLDAKSRGLSNLRKQIAGSGAKGPVNSTVADAACLDCHEDITKGTVVARSIDVRHSDIIEAGYHCVECHNTEGHGYDVARPRYPEMRYCITCHSKSEKLSACTSCHPEDAGVAVRRSRRIFPKTDVIKEDCRGCHSMQPCIECHGIELPHTRKFVSGYHAKWAYTNLEMCLSCHDMYAFCGPRCHNFAKSGIVSKDGLHRIGEQHGSDFRVTHRSKSASYCAGCHGEADMCEFCHGDLPEH